MKNKIFTSGGYTPKHFSRHMTNYVFAANRIKNKLGLEIGCNKAYGTYYLSHFAGRIIGIDIDLSNILLGVDVFPRGRFDLLAMDATMLGFKDDTFDFIFSSHLIEHIPLDQHDNFVRECARVLKPDGTFYAATPNLEYNLKKPHHMDVMCKKHSKEFMRIDLEDLLSKAFRKVTIYGVRVSRKQRIYRRLKKIGLINWLPNRFNPIVNFYNNCDENDFVVTPKDIPLSQDLLAICQK